MEATIPKHIVMQLDEVHFRQFLLDYKTVELRLRRGKYAELNIDDTFTAICRETGETFQGVFTEITYHRTFEGALIREGLKHVLPQYFSIDRAINEVYYKIPGYKDFENCCGVVALKVKKINMQIDR